MANFTADFEAGVDGATITTGAGEASATAWGGVDGTPTYDNDQAIGTLAMKIAGASNSVLWTSDLGIGVTGYGRFCLYVPSWPTGNGVYLGAACGDSVRFTLETDGKFRIYDSGFAHNVTSTGSVATGQWVRFEYEIVPSATVAQVVMRYYTTPYSSSVGEELASPATWTTNTALGQIRFGRLGDAGTLSAYWMDDIVGNATDWVGPAPAPKQTLLPSADSVDGAWTDQAGGSSLAAAIDEATFDDADYIRSDLNPSASGCRVKLSAGGDPHLSTDHVINWRTGKIGSATINMTVKLYQGGGNSQGAGTLIATFNRNNVGALTTYTETLSGGEADSITDYTDLYLEFFADTA